MKVLNLYCGIGGNRKLWTDVEVTAVEINSKVAESYKERFPNDVVIVEDAHAFLLNNFSDFDFIWASPPCPSHSRFTRSGINRKPTYPDMKLYEEILFLKYSFKGKWVVENVVPYYEPLIPARKIGRHLFWSNFNISSFKEQEMPKSFINDDSPAGIKRLSEYLGIEYGKNIYLNTHSPAQVLRNCVHPDLGLYIFEQMRNIIRTPKTKQHSLFS